MLLIEIAKLNQRLDARVKPFNDARHYTAFKFLYGIRPNFQGLSNRVCNDLAARKNMNVKADGVADGMVTPTINEKPM